MKMKRVLGLALIGLSAITLSSCLLANRDLGVNEDLTYSFTESDWEQIQADMARFEESLKSESRTDLVGAWNSINRSAEALITYRTIEYANYSVDGNEAAYNRYLALQDKIVILVKWFESMYKPIYESIYSTEFYAGMSEAEIQKLVNSTKPDRFYELEAENEALLKPYRDYSPQEIHTQSAELYHTLVTNYHEQATVCGYTNYLDYAYEYIYDREYTKDNVTVFNEYVKTYIVPMLFEYKTKVTEAEAKLTDNDWKEVNSLNKNFYQSKADELQEYAEYVGGGYLESYNYFTTDGYVYLGNSEKSLEGAYTTYLYIDTLDQPIMYFGKNYQNTLSFVHEFGHYNSFKVNGAQKFNYDLAESQSQGNEMLFTAWLYANNKYSDATLEYISDKQIYDALTSVVMCSVVSEFEIRVYANPTMEASKYDALNVEVYDYFGGYDKIMSCIYGDNYKNTVEYWKRVALDNAGYYISYAISLVPALDLYKTALTNIDSAKQSYQALYKPQNGLTQEQFLDVIEAAGLGNPFEESTYLRLSNAQ